MVSISNAKATEIDHKTSVLDASDDEWLGRWRRQFSTFDIGNRGVLCCGMLTHGMEIVSYRTGIYNDGRVNSIIFEGV